MKKILYVLIFCCCGFLTAQQQVIELEREVEVQAKSTNPLAIQTPRLAHLYPNITQVDAKTLRYFQHRNFHDVVKQVAGMYAWATYGQTRTTLGARGYRDVTYLKEGVPMGMATGEMQGVENIHFITGSAAMGFGRVVPGGVYFVEQKMALLEQMAVEAGARIKGGSTAALQPFFDINVPIAERWAFRLNGSYEKADGMRAYNESKNYFIAPAFLFQPQKNIKISLQYEFLYNQTRPENGAFVFLPDFAHTPSIYYPSNERFYGFLTDKQLYAQHFVNGKISYQISPKTQLQAQLAYVNEQSDYFKTAPNKNLVTLKDQAGVIQGYKPEFIRKITQQEQNSQLIYAQIDLINQHFGKGAVQHGFDFGMDVLNKSTKTNKYNTKTIDTIDIENYTVVGAEKSKNKVNITEPKQRPDADGVDNVSLTNTSLLARYQVQLTKYVDITASTRVIASQTMGSPVVDWGWNPYAAVQVHPIKNLDFFFTFSRAFVPTTLQDKTTKTRLSADYHTQYELGTRYKPFDWMDFRLTLYQIGINNKNESLWDEEKQDIDRVYGTKAGALRNRGIEFDMHVRPVAGVWLQAGYSFVHARYLKSPVYKENSTPFNVPDHTFFLWANYTFEQYAVKGLSLGIGGNFVGRRYANDQTYRNWHDIPANMPTLTYAPYFQLDAQIGYRYRFLQASLKLNNLTNTVSYTSYRTQYVNRIEGFNAALQLSYRL